MTGPWTKGAVATTPGVLSIFVLSVRQSCKTSSVVTRMCASKSITFCLSSRSNPVMTEITRIKTVTPSITPSTEIKVMIERKVRFGFKYRSARKKLNGSFNSAIPWPRMRYFSRTESNHQSEKEERSNHHIGEWTHLQNGREEIIRFNSEQKQGQVLQTDRVPCLETPGVAPLSVPTRAHITAVTKICRIESQAGNHRKSVTVAGIDRDPSAATAFSEAEKFARWQRLIQRAGIMQCK